MVKQKVIAKGEFCITGGDDLLFEMNVIFVFFSPDTQLSAFRNKAFLPVAVGSVKDYLFTAEFPLKH